MSVGGLGMDGLRVDGVERAIESQGPRDVIKAPTEAQWRAMTAEGRMTVRTRAAKLGNALGDATVALIDSLNLPLSSSGGMSVSDPLYLEMRRVAWSAEGKAAILRAAKEGQPALVGLDLLFQEKMGERYRKAGQAEKNCGYITAELMRHLGYEEAGKAKIPPGCFTKSGAKWRFKTPLA